MRVLIQRVSRAKVNINDEKFTSMGAGLLIFVGIEPSDTEDDIGYLCKKIISLRIFNDSKGMMNNSVKDILGDIMVVSQFTLHALTKKGNRPSYLRAAPSKIAIPIYKNFIKTLEYNFKKAVYTGRFGADMKVDLVNDGPVTIIIDTKNKTL